MDNTLMSYIPVALYLNVVLILSIVGAVLGVGYAAVKRNNNKKQ